MKKLFTFIAALTMATGVFATDYTDDLVVTVNGVSAAPQKTTITVTPNDNGTYNFSLKNFSFGGINIGDIDMNNVPAAKQDGITYLSDTQTISLTIGILMSLPVTLRAELRDNETKMYASMDIYVADFQQNVNVIFGGGYQLPNSGFENFHSEVLHSPNSSSNPTGWKNDTLKIADVPNAWHSFMDASGAIGLVYYASYLTDPHTYMSNDVRPGTAGQHSAKVVARNVMFNIIANGTITTGRMNTGSMAAADRANHAWLDIDSTGTDSHGDPFYTILNGRPDSLCVWVKYNQGKAVSDHPYATVSAIITDGTYYQDPEAENTTYTNVVAKAQNAKIEATGDNWKRIEIPFDYSTYAANNAEGKAILITISTNADAGQGSANDSILVDDISLVYNDPVNVQVNWNDENIDKSKGVSVDDIAVSCEGTNGARIVKSLKQNGDNVEATVMVFNGDLTKKIDEQTHTYEGTTTGVRAISLDDVTDANAPEEIYNISGQRVSSMQPGQVYVVKKGGKTVKVMK